MAERNNFPRPDLGQVNLGALAGAVLGSIGGLFSVGIPPAIVFRDVRALFATPTLGVISFIVCGLLGWLLGGQVGPWFGRKYQSIQAEFISGAIFGAIPVVMVLVWSYWMVTH